LRPWQNDPVDDFRPGVDRIAGKGRGDVPAAIDRRDAESVGQPVEGKRARQADDVTAVDDPAAEAPGLFGLLVEVHAGGVLVEAGGHHVFTFFDGHAVNVIDAFADLVVVPQVRAA
jgi:hypothetical protein